MKDKTIKEIMGYIRKSGYGQVPSINLWSPNWRREYTFSPKGEYFCQGYKRDSYSITGWSSSQATGYTEKEMYAHIAQNYRKFKREYFALKQ